jgi:hypothetical protein
MAAEKFVINGVNGVTGAYGLPPLTVEELALHIQEDASLGRDSRGSVVIGDRVVRFVGKPA